MEEAAEANDWDVAQALNEARHVDQDADFFRLNGYGHLESVSKASLLEDARDNIDDIIDWLGNASRYDLEDISSDIELMVDANDPFEIINEVDCSVRKLGNNIEVELSRGQDKAALSFSKLDDIDADKIDLANEALGCKYISSALEKMGFDVENGRVLEKHVDLETKQRFEFDAELGDDFGEVSKYLGEFFGSGSVNQSEKINDSWGNSILVKGGNGRYDGPRGGITVYDNFEEAVDTSPSRHGGNNIFADCEIDGIWDENGSLFLTGAHHDGRALVEMRQLTDKGERLYSDYQMDGGFYLPEDGVEAMGFVYREGDENAFIHDLWDNPEMCSKPKWAEKVGGFPAEEYIMNHNGLKTEFQISEIKRDSFAYDQGARFDVKVLTDGHDCGNGRFCADLDEAHDFCGQFVNDLAGFGESLDDMCEDRNEVACAVQAVDTGDRHREDEQSLDSLCDEKTDEAQSLRYGMEGVGLPMLDAAEHLANY